MNKLYETSLHLQSYQALDMAVFVKNLKGKYLWANNYFVQKSAGFKSVHEIYHKEDFHFAWYEFADDLRANDKLLIEGREGITVKERITRHDGNCVNIISKKSPLFNMSNTIIGLIGFCMEIPLSSAAQLLTPREYETISLLAKGNADKEIAKKLGISPRTVETHINNGKVKLNVATRAELVVKVLT